MNPKPYYVGIDISKQTLDVFIHTLNISFKTSNSPTGFSKLLARLRRHLKDNPFHIVFEATGGYEQALLDWLCLNNIPRSRLNAAWVRDFAKSQGLLAKTDKIDARLIASYAAVSSPKETPAPTPSERELSILVNRRRELLTERTAQKNRLQHLDPKSKVARQIKKHIKSIENQIKEVDKWMDDLLKNDPLLNQKVSRICKIVGIAKQSALCFLARMPELGSLTRRQAAALAGVAPCNCDSGSKRGQRVIKAGRSHLRETLYMVALVASQHNPILKAFYVNLRNRGKLAKVALVAVMRKMIQLINHVLKNPSFQIA